MKNYFYILIPLLLFSLILSSDDNHTSHLEKIVLGSGCFWGAEKGYEGLQGVE
ncbi:MAG: peptide methionine sulfoxide reductase, partial [Gammaproteobacteria bacterium]